jgi:hypothetical protein
MAVFSIQSVLVLSVVVAQGSVVSFRHAADDAGPASSKTIERIGQADQR